MAKVNIKQNVTYKVTDSSGREKKLFQPNALLRWFIKHGVISANSIMAKIPVLFGYWSNKMVISNLITNAGFAGVASRINGDGAEAAFTYIAVGIGTTAANVADTTLETEITDSGMARAAATASRVQTDVANDTAQLTKTFTVTGSKAVTESGVLNASSAGVLLARQVFAAINVADGDSLAITWKFDID